MRGKWGFRSACVLVTLATVAACGGKLAGVDGPDEGSGTGVGGGVPTGSGTGTAQPKTDPPLRRDAGRPHEDDEGPPNAPECPETFSEGAGNCTKGLTCAYPEGSCTCVGYCGSTPPPPNVDHTHWSCTARDEACPAQQPVERTECNVPTARCTYRESCCSKTFVCSATTGKWWFVGPLKCDG